MSDQKYEKRKAELEKLQEQQKLDVGGEVVRQGGAGVRFRPAPGGRKMGKRIGARSQVSPEVQSCTRSGREVAPEPPPFEQLDVINRQPTEQKVAIARGNDDLETEKGMQAFSSLQRPNTAQLSESVDKPTTPSKKLGGEASSFGIADAEVLTSSA